MAGEGCAGWIERAAILGFRTVFARVRKAWDGEPGDANSTGLPRGKACAAERVFYTVLIIYSQGEGGRGSGDGGAAGTGDGESVGAGWSSAGGVSGGGLPQVPAPIKG